MLLPELFHYAQEKSIQYPQHKEEIQGFYDLAVAESEDECESEEHECDMAVDSIDDLVSGKE